MIEPGKPSKPHPDSATNKCINIDKVVMTEHMLWHKNHKPYSTSKEHKDKKDKKD